MYGLQLCVLLCLISWHALVQRPAGMSESAMALNYTKARVVEIIECRAPDRGTFRGILAIEWLATCFVAGGAAREVHTAGRGNMSGGPWGTRRKCSSDVHCGFIIANDRRMFLLFCFSDQKVFGRKRHNFALGSAARIWIY